MGFLEKIFGNREAIDIGDCSYYTIEASGAKGFAEELSIEFIAKTIARAEFQTFNKGKTVRENNYYLLNVEANRNQTSTEFWKEFIKELLSKGEVLALNEDGKELYVAESFERQQEGMQEATYTNIVVSGKNITRIYKESQVFHLTFDRSKINLKLEELNKFYDKLIVSSRDGFLSKNSKKYFVDIPTSGSQTKEAQENLRELFEVQFKDFFDPTKNSALPLRNNLKVENADKDSKQSTGKESDKTADSFIDSLISYVAMAYNIPPSLLKGDTVDTKDAVNNYITFCINPLAKLITEEINRKLYGKEQYLKRSYCKVDTSVIKAVDIRDVANSIDLLTRNGAYTIDDTLMLLGKEPIGGEIGTARFVTKNYGTAEQVISGDIKGGGK